MADYRLSAQVISRSAGRSSVAAAAYRSASHMVDERTGEIHDYTRKGGLVHEEILAPENTPEWMQDREQLWNAVEQVERRKDAQLAREVQLSLPHELEPDQRLDLDRSLVQDQFVSRGMIADLALHEPGKSGDQRNHHAHVMLTMRELAGDGFGKKNRDWNSKELLAEHRSEWARYQNHFLEHYRHESRVDHRSYEERGIDREATQHLGPNAHEMEARGEPSRIGNENREIQAANSDRAQDHKEAAQLKLQIEREKAKFERWAGGRRDELAHIQELASLDLDQKFQRQKLSLEAELRETYGQHKDTIQAELDTLDRKLEATGLRKFVRDVFGRTRADRSDREDLQKTVASIEQRETESRTALDQQQKQAREAEKQRQRDNRERLENRILTALQNREKTDWKPFEPTQLRPPEPEPRFRPEAKTNTPPAQERPQEPLQARQKPEAPAKPVTPPPEPEKAPQPEKSREWWRSTSTDHKPTDYSELHSRWDRSVKLPSQDQTGNPFAGPEPSRWDTLSNPFSESANPFSHSNDNERGQDRGPSPSPEGGGSGGGGKGGGSGGGAG